MHYNVAEVAPAIPAFLEMLGPLIIICGLIVALGTSQLLVYLVKAVLHTLAGIFSVIPFIGGITEGLIRQLEQVIVNALGTGIAKIEGAIGHQWHNLARIARFWWNLTVRMAHATWEEAQALGRLVSGATLNHLLHDIRKLVNSVRSAALSALHRIIHLEHVFTKTIAHGVYPRLRAAEHAIEVTLPREIKAARDLAREAEDGVKRLWDWTRNLADNPALAAAIATAIAALGMVGIDLIKCRESKNIYDKRGCGLWGDLDALLGIFAAAELALHIDEIVKIVEELTDPAVAVIKKAE